MVDFHVLDGNRMAAIRASAAELSVNGFSLLRCYPSSLRRESFGEVFLSLGDRDYPEKRGVHRKGAIPKRRIFAPARKKARESLVIGGVDGAFGCLSRSKLRIVRYEEGVFFPALKEMGDDDETRPQRLSDVIDSGDPAEFSDGGIRFFGESLSPGAFTEKHDIQPHESFLDDRSVCHSAEDYKRKVRA